jgi:hypothetical protein
LDDITPALARRSGFASVVDLLKTAKHGAGERVFVIDFHYDDDAPARTPPATGVVGADELRRPRDEFKRDVRKLKNLGLTLSLEIGYRLTPRGEALLDD